MGIDLADARVLGSGTAIGAGPCVDIRRVLARGDMLHVLGDAPRVTVAMLGVETARDIRGAALGDAMPGPNERELNGTDVSEYDADRLIGCGGTEEDRTAALRGSSRGVAVEGLGGSGACGVEDAGCLETGGVDQDRERASFGGAQTALLKRAPSPRGTRALPEGEVARERPPAEAPAETRRRTPGRPGEGIGDGPAPFGGGAAIATGSEEDPHANFVCSDASWLSSCCRRCCAVNSRLSWSRLALWISAQKARCSCSHSSKLPASAPAGGAPRVGAVEGPSAGACREGESCGEAALALGGEAGAGAA